MSYASTVLADNPFAYYPLDETSGTIAHDATGNGHDGTLAGGVTWGGPQIGAGLGSSATFNGSSGIITLPTPMFTTPSGSMSIEAWSDLTDAVNNTASGVFALTSGGSDYFDIEYNYHQIRFECKANNGVTFQQWTGSASDANTPFHLVMTYSAVTGAVNAYVNGQFVFGGTTSAGGFISSTVAQIGKWDRYFTGQISNVAAYPVELSAAQISAHYLAGTFYAPAGALSDGIGQGQASASLWAMGASLGAGSGLALRPSQHGPALSGIARSDGRLAATVAGSPAISATTTPGPGIRGTIYG